MSQKLSQKIKTQIKGNALTRKGDVIIAQAHKKYYDPLRYCCTRGYKVDMGHNSWTCRTARHRKNHNKKATWGDTMGGCERNKYWTPDK